VKFSWMGCHGAMGMSMGSFKPPIRPEGLTPELRGLVATHWAFPAQGVCRHCGCSDRAESLRSAPTRLRG